MKYLRNKAAKLKYSEFKKHLRTIERNRDMINAEIEEA